MLKVLRAEIPDIIGFEEIAIMCKPPDGSDSFTALSPNLSKQILTSQKHAELFFLYPLTGFSVECIRTNQIRHVRSPRNYDNFQESWDCLCPLVFLRDIVFIPLRTTNGQVVGCMQAVNKQFGEVSEDDVKLLTLLAPIMANSLNLILTGVIMSQTMDQIAISASNLTNCVEKSCKIK